MSINIVCVSGNLTRDPDIRTTQSGTAVLSFCVAVNERVKEGGDWKDRPSFIDCVMFGSRAQSVARFLSKGSKATVSGRLRQQRWEKDGQNRSKVEVIVDDIDFGSASRDNAKHDSHDDASLYDEDIPF